MGRIISISGKQNDYICQYSFDPNKLHDEQHMADRNKKAIVAGMGIFASAAHPYVDSSIRQANINLGEFVSIGDKLKVESIDSLLKSEEIEFDKKIISAKNSEGVDVLSAGEEPTWISELPINYTPHKGRPMSIEFDKNSPRNYAHCAGTKHDEVSRFLYAIGLSSGALQNSINSPKTELEKEIKVKMSGDKPIIPVYRSMTISIPGGIVNLEDKPVHFLTSLEQVGRRDIAAIVDFFQEGTLFYQAKFSLQVVNAKTIYNRMAKPLD